MFGGRWSLVDSGKSPGVVAGCVPRVTERRCCGVVVRDRCFRFPLRGVGDIHPANSGRRDCGEYLGGICGDAPRGDRGRPPLPLVMNRDEPGSRMIGSMTNREGSIVMTFTRSGGRNAAAGPLAADGSAPAGPVGRAGSRRKMLVRPVCR